jgi:hypothetical protein
MTEQAGEAKKDQKPRHRSPNYPGIGLRAAIAKIEALYKADGLAASPKLAALKHMGYDKLHSEAARTLSALKSFGLVDETTDRIKLTQRGIEIVARPAGDARRQKAIEASAVSPEIYQQVMEEYRLTGLPSDSSLKSDLITVRKFNPSAVDGFVRDFRDTLEFAGLSDVKVLQPKQEQDGSGDQQRTPQIGDYVQWESNGQIQFHEPRRIRALAEDGLWAFVDGSDTGLAISELTVVASGTVDKPGEQVAAADPLPSERLKQSKSEGAPQVAAPPKMRSYSWALSGDFSAKMELFGDAHSEEDIDALADYVEITIRALKRSLKSQSLGGKG